MHLADVMDPTVVISVLVIGDLGRDRGALVEIERSSDLSFVGAHAEVDDALRMIARSPASTPDVVVIARGADVPAATRAVKAALTTAKVLIVGGRQDATAVADAMSAGASGVLPGSEDVARLVQAIRRAAAGEIVLPEHHLTALVQRVDAGRARPAAHAIDRLTSREREILRSLAAGRSATEIGADLGISALTVQTHLKSILAKLGAHSKIEAITLAWRAGLAPTPTNA
ncbi:MAG TPA: response regulator transcription factor [Actinomycetota bacterium]|jgi:DNA-binding NarL/FixJ family response regulator|nr:response regulator transcription factor [Actinomycetota bacterium]